MLSKIGSVCVQLDGTIPISCHCAYIFVVIECIEDIVRQTAKQVNDEPRFQIIHSYYFRIADHFTARPHERRMKV